MDVDVIMDVDLDLNMAMESLKRYESASDFKPKEEALKRYKEGFQAVVL